MNKSILRALADIETNLGGDEFIKIFGKYDAIHLFKKFVGYKYSILTFYCYLDIQNTKLFNAYIAGELEKQNLGVVRISDLMPLIA
jgi:hypothetical protein